MNKLKVAFILCLTAFSLSACHFSDYGDSDINNENDIDNTNEDETDNNPEDTVSSDVAERYENIMDQFAIDENDEDEDSDDSSDEDSDDEEDSDSQFVSENHDAIEELLAERDELMSAEPSYDRDYDLYELYKKIDELNCYDFSDVRITFLGDSITYGQGGDKNQYNNFVSYVDYVRDILGCKTTNLSSPGAPIGSYGGYESMVYRANDIPGDTDIIVVFGGINDFFYEKDVFGDDSYEEGTFTGDARKMCEEIREQFPDEPVYMILIYPGIYETLYCSDSYLPINGYLQVERSLAKEYNFNVIDLYSNGLLDSNDYSVANVYFNDDVHPNNSGYLWLGRCLATEIIAAYN